MHISISVSASDREAPYRLHEGLGVMRSASSRVMWILWVMWCASRMLGFGVGWNRHGRPSEGQQRSGVLKEPHVDKDERESRDQFTNCRGAGSTTVLHRGTGPLYSDSQQALGWTDAQQCWAPRALCASLWAPRRARHEMRAATMLEMDDEDDCRSGKEPRRRSPADTGMPEHRRLGRSCQLLI